MAQLRGVMRVIATWMLVVFASGCGSYTAIRPSEAPKLNGSFVGAAGTNTVAVRVAHVEKPDGSIHEVRGEYDLRVTSRSWGAITFEHPVVAKLSGHELTLAGANQPATTFSLADLESVEVSGPSGAALNIIGILAGIAGVALFLTLQP